jgi:RNA polymerase sigma-70 factor (ECF subfamily)
MTAAEIEANLLDRACQGDTLAFGDLYELLLDEMYRYMYYRTARRRDAEDLTEELFYKAWRNLGSFRRERDASLRSWLYRIAANLVVDYYRRSKDHLPLPDEPALLDQRPLPEQQLMARGDRQAVVTAVAALPSDFQQVLILRFVNGYSAAETGDIMARSAGAVRVLQHRALSALRVQLVVKEVVHG